MTSQELSIKNLSKPIINQRDFANLDELVELVNQTRNYNIYPLSRDSFHYHFTQIDFGVIKFIKTKIDSPVHLVGDRLKDWREFIVYLNNPSRLIWNNYVPLSSQYLFGFANDCEANFVFPCNLIIGSFRIQETYFQHYLKTLNYLEIDADFLRRDYIFLPTTLQPVQTYLRELFCLVDRFPEFLNQEHFKNLILEDFIPLFIQAIAPQTSAPRPGDYSPLSTSISERSQGLYDGPFRGTDYPKKDVSKHLC
ncbi:MAG: hypothetical protein VKJ02_18925 [Snowella sp.]|nr:hypothetical protein [Snowella sp.]